MSDETTFTFAEKSSVMTARSDTVFIGHDGSDWDCHCFGGSGIKWNPPKGQVPNWFWRKMQYLILGNKWVKRSAT